MRTVVGLFKRLEEAQKVVETLTQSGFNREDISLVKGDREGKFTDKMKGDQDVAEGAASGAGIGAAVGGLGGLLVGLGALAIPGIGPVIAAGPIATALAGAGIGAASGGLIGALVDIGVPEQHAKAYEEGLLRGDTLVTARVPDERADQAVSIMNRFNPIDIDDKSSTQSEQMEGERPHYEGEQIPTTGDRVDDMTIPVVEEEIRIGKREVDRGGMRIHTYTTEHDVEEDVTLRSEHINVERRPVDREATEADFHTFEEGTMELREKSEEPVVEKRSRVVEEVDISKDVEDRTETVRDTVRRKDVNVESTGPSQAGGDEWNQYEQLYRQDFQTRYGQSGRNFNYYMPAYRYGYDLRHNPRYQNYSWDQVEREAHMDWERRGGQGAWEDIVDAVRHGWESIRR